MQTNDSQLSTKERICKAGFEHFIAYGYEGASINNIAEAVGIRKSSFYTHFKTKDDLFTFLLEMSFETEQEFLEECFNKKSNAIFAGENFLLSLKNRFIERIECRFMIRMAYVPPAHLVELINQKYDFYNQTLRTLYVLGLTQLIPQLTKSQIELYTTAYIGIMDSLAVDLLYGGYDNYDQRLHALSTILKHSLERI